METPHTQVDDGLLAAAGAQLAASITNLRNQWLQYSNHKEQMAYVAATVYIGSAATIVTQEDLAKQLQTGVGEVSAILIAASAFLFVIWQLDRLRVAREALAVCNEILVGVQSPGSSTPAALRLATAFEGPHGVFPRRPLMAELATILLMVIFSVLAGIAIWRKPVVLRSDGAATTRHLMRRCLPPCRSSSNTSPDVRCEVTETCEPFELRGPGFVRSRQEPQHLSLGVSAYTADWRSTHYSRSLPRNHPAILPG